MYDPRARWRWEFKVNEKAKQITINTVVIYDSKSGWRWE